MSLFDLDDPPVAISFRDALEPSDYIFGDDKNAPEDADGESLAWEGELLDGYPIEDETMADVLERKRKKNKKARLEQQVARELPHVRASSPNVALYVARLRAARVMKLASSEVHDLYYDGRVPSGMERLAELGFSKEARFATSAQGRGRVLTAGRRVTLAQDGASSFPEDPPQETMAPPAAAPAAEPEGDQGSVVTEGRRRGRPFGHAAAMARESDHLKFVDALCEGLGSKHADAANFLVGDRVKPKGVQDSSEDATVSDIGSDGSVTVQEVDSGSPVIYKEKASDKLQRTAGPAARTAMRKVANDDRSTVIRKANQIGQLSRKGGAPRLDENSDIGTLIGWLEWNDPNGDYREYELKEGVDEDDARWPRDYNPIPGIDVDTAWELIADQSSEEEDLGLDLVHKNPYLAKRANVPDPNGMKHQTHGPKGVRLKPRRPNRDGVADPHETAALDPDVIEAVLEPFGLMVALRWPNLSKLSAALPKLAARDWLSGLDRAVARSGGAWATDSEAFELQARFPTKDAARRFAELLAGEFYVLPESIEASVRQPEPGAMKMGLLRVDMARRVILPGGVVFALEASVQPQDFRPNEGVIVMDPISQALAEGVVASVGPDLVVIVASDGTQYEYSRGYLRRLTLAKLSLAHVDDTVLPLGTPVSIGKKTGVLAGWDLDRTVPQVRVRFADGPRWAPRAAVVATVRVAQI